MTNPSVSQRVCSKLAALERDHAVRVLYACESGSRAWGFASPDSDYDVRFVYVHRRDWYLSVRERRDVVEMPLEGDLDVSGWELRKALRLLRKSNPSLLEWFGSPFVYRQDPAFAAEFRQVAAAYTSPQRCFVHYLHMAFGNWRSYLKDREEVKLKKYLYVLRPLLACRWVERGLGPVPVVFQKLVDAVLDEAPVREELAALLERKQANDESAVVPAVPVLSHFAETELARLDALPGFESPEPDQEELDQFFRRHCPAA